MSPEEITNRVMNEIEDFVGDCPQSDDITMLAIKRDE
jgi:serine phosphatase RsbU (regulator of sigma subunit)